MVHDALWITCRARSVVEGDRLPFVLRPRPGSLGIAFGEEVLVFRPAERCVPDAVMDFDERHWSRKLVHRPLDDRCEFPVRDQQLGLPVRQNKRNRARVEAVIQRAEHRPRNRHAVMRLQQCRHVRRHDGHRIAAPDTAPAQGIGKAAGASVEGAVREASGFMDDCELVWVYRGGARQESQGAQRRKIRRVPSEMRRIIEFPTWRGFDRRHGNCLTGSYGPGILRFRLKASRQASYRVTRRPVKKYSIAPTTAASPVTQSTGGSLISFLAGDAAPFG